ncbi:histidine kinase [Solwaraspora sp. WMMB335]|uniref:sensor histidine kinase n=1 Tax=Solwaraspora sp. WMMB335 TaxID=3404118 RepID=UPI003B9372FB
MTTLSTPTTTRTAARQESTVLEAIGQVVAGGLAVLDEQRRVIWVNSAAATLLDVPAAQLLDRPWPYELVAISDEAGSRATGVAETWTGRRAAGARRVLQYDAAWADVGGTKHMVISITDVTESRRQEQRLAAIARAASSVADAGRLSVTLDALAQAVFESTGLAAVQILTLHGPDRELRMMGEAGFSDVANFSERLARCRRRGAELKMLEAADRCAPVVVPHRKPVIMNSPAWEPLHDIMGAVDWDSFVSMPLAVREECVGVLNAFFAPGEDPGPAELEFLAAIADQAALAVDYAGLLATSRAEVRREERQRLASDLHDSVVQRVFSMRMQATALRARIGQREPGVSADLGPITDELLALSKTTLADLRDLIFELRPAELVDAGLLEALRVHAASTEARTGMRIRIQAPESLGEVPVEAQEDLYRIVQEALQNVVKHARASLARVRFRVTGSTRDGLEIDVRDDGCGDGGHDNHTLGMGMVSMTERAARWGGVLDAGPLPGGGFRVRAVFPRLLTNGVLATDHPRPEELR